MWKKVSILLLERRGCDAGLGQASRRHFYGNINATSLPFSFWPPEAGTPLKLSSVWK